MFYKKDKENKINLNSAIDNIKIAKEPNNDHTYITRSRRMIEDGIRK